MFAFLHNKQKIFNENIEAKIIDLENRLFDENFKIKARLIELSKTVEQLEKMQNAPVKIDYNELFKEIKSIKNDTTKAL